MNQQAPKAPQNRPALKVHEGAAASFAARAVARPARLAARHRRAAGAFAVMVALPVLLASLYMGLIARDQFVSNLAFSIHSEEAPTPSPDLLAGLTGLGGSSSKDADILYEFINSQPLVEEVNRRIDLRRIYGRAHLTDPVFAMDPDASIEDMVDYWERVVRIDSDTASGILSLEVQGFSPDDARLVAKTIYDVSSEMINRLSAIAREDTTRYAREDFEAAVERLKSAREAITSYRMKSNIVDPAADVAGQVGLVTELQNQLANALLDLDMLNDKAPKGDPRIETSSRRIEVIRRRIAEERGKVSASEPGDNQISYAKVVEEFERLTVDLEVAEEAYKMALVAYDASLSEARRKSRYLAAHVPPTLAQSSVVPERVLTVALVALFALLSWAITVLIYYSLRDRR